MQLEFDKEKYRQTHGLERWELIETKCKCHTETCNCYPYTVKMDSKVMCGVFDKSNGKTMVDRLNHSAFLCQLAYDYATGKIDGAEICRYVKIHVE